MPAFPKYLKSMSYPLTFQVHIADGIQFVREFRTPGTNDSSTVVLENGNSSQVEQQGNKNIDILIIDVDATDSR